MLFAYFTCMNTRSLIIDYQERDLKRELKKESYKLFINMYSLSVKKHGYVNTDDSFESIICVEYYSIKYCVLASFVSCVNLTHFSFSKTSIKCA